MFTAQNPAGQPLEEPCGPDQLHRLIELRRQHLYALIDRVSGDLQHPAVQTASADLDTLILMAQERAIKTTPARLFHK